MYNLNKFYNILKRLLSYSFPYYKVLIIAIIMLWFASIAEVAGPMIVSYFINNVMLNNVLLIYNLTILLIGLILLQIASAILRYYQSLLFSKIALNIIQKIRTELMIVILKQPLSVLNQHSVGKLISRVTNDTEVIKDLYITVISSVLKSSILILTMLFAMFLLDWKLACIILVLFPIIFIIMIVYQHFSTPVIRKLRSYVADINDIFNEVINGMEIIQQFCQQDRFGKKLKKTNQLHFYTRIKSLKLEGYLLRPLISFIFALILCGIILIFGLNKYNTVGVLYAFINYLGRINEPLIELTAQQSIIQQSMIAGERIFELLDSPIQKYGNDNYPIINSTIEFCNLSFSYNNKNLILKNINFKVLPKSFVALVGNTGSGKSTLANLIMGYYPVKSKSILIDNRSIETLSYKLLRKSIYMVQQDPIIFTETVYFNITLGKKISEKEVWCTLDKINMSSFIKTLPNGLYTKIGEKGNILSVGQKQLLSLARILIFIPNFLILDEATANIDSKTEQSIANVLEIIRKKTTLIVIAHRLSTILDADQIIVLNNGKIIEHGNHIELINKKGYYYKMYKLQKNRNNIMFI